MKGTVFLGWFKRALSGVLSPHVLFLIAMGFAVYGAHCLLGIIFYAALFAVLIGYGVAKWRSLRRTSWQDWINPVKWLSVFYAFCMKSLFPMHVVEQMFVRMNHIVCRQCVAKGSCIGCGCDMSKVYVPWESCSEEHWGPMVMNAQKYKELREKYPVMTLAYYPSTTEGNANFTIGTVQDGMPAPFRAVKVYYNDGYNDVDFETNELPHDLYLPGLTRNVVEKVRTIRSVYQFLAFAAGKHGIANARDFNEPILRTLAIDLKAFDWNVKDPIEVNYQSVYYGARNYLENVVLKEHPEVQMYDDFYCDELQQMAKQVRLFG